MALGASVPFFLVHASAIAAFFLPFRWEFVLLAVASYYVRMFFVTAGYHRYFSHRAFSTGRFFQFLLAFGAQTSVQKGVLWWAANHRHHHRYSDMENDIHSPARRGFWWAHAGWILATRYDETNLSAVKDLARFPELRFLDRHRHLPAVIFAAALTAIGGLPWLVWGFLIPTAVLWHGTFTINSLTHIFGKRRYLTTDNSRNSFVLALITCGEGWHNNHHFHQNTANQGWFWWEIDLSYYALVVLSWVGLVSKLRKPPEHTRRSHEQYTEAQRALLKKQSRFSEWQTVPTHPTPESMPAVLVPASART